MDSENPSKKFIQEQAFESFWKLYWRRVGKGAARKAFAVMVRDEKTFREVMAGIKAQTPLMLAREIIYVPHASTWLRSERWTDEVEHIGGERVWMDGVTPRNSDDEDYVL